MKATKMGNLFFMPNTYAHPSLSPLNPQAWATTIARKEAQEAREAAERALKRRGLVPSLEMI